MTGLFNVLRRFRPWLAGEHLVLSGGIAAVITTTIFKLLEPWPLKVVVDRVLRGDPTASAGNLVLLCALALLAITALRALVQFIATSIFSQVGSRVVTRLRTALFDHIQRLSGGFHDTARAGDITLRLVGDIGMLKDTAVTAIMPLLANTLVLAGMTGVMLWLDWRLALIALLPLPLLWIATTRISRRIGEASRDTRKREGAIAATVGEAMTGMRAIQALGLEKSITQMFSRANERSLTGSIRTAQLAAGLERAVDAAVGIALAVILWTGAHAVLSGRLSVGELLVFVTYLKNTFRPVREYAKYSSRIAKAGAAAERVFALMDIAPEIIDRPGATKAPAFRGAVTYENVQFAYAGKPEILTNLNLSIPPGQNVAVVGPSGIGKSTLVSLLLRLRDPTGGHVRIDGLDITDVTLDSLRQQIAFVPQEPLLFSTTIVENIALGKDGATHDEIEAAARLVSAHDFIMALPQGYNTPMAERGITLSVGQRQRVALARAALRDAPVIMLDEPTASLDSQSGIAVADAIITLGRNRTVILVTHSLSLAARMDRIVLLDQGRVVEDGCHAALMAQNGCYARMWRLQQGQVHALAG